MYVDTRLSGVGRGTRVVASVSGRGVPHRQYARGQLVRRHRNAVLLVVVHHSVLVVPRNRSPIQEAKEEEEEEKSNFKSHATLEFFLSSSYQKTYSGLSVARFSLHSSRSVEPSSICKSGASRISAAASVWRKHPGNGRKKRKKKKMQKHSHSTRTRWWNFRVAFPRWLRQGKENIPPWVIKIEPAEDELCLNANRWH